MHTEHAAVRAKSARRAQMKWDRIAANWNQLRGIAQEKWSMLTDATFDLIAGNREQLLGWLQAQYSISRAEAELEVREWEEMVHERERHPRS